MNLRITLRLCSLLLIMGSYFASAEAQIRLGYCNEEPTVSSLGHNSTTATISCAMGLSKQLQSPYTDLSLSHLRVAIMQPERLTSLRVWVRESLTDTTTLASAEVDPLTLNAGWNSLALNQPIALDAQKILYCGYSYTQSERLDIAISGKKNQTNAFWIAADENWIDYSKRFAPVCIQAELTSSYANAIMLNDCQLEHAYVNREADPRQLQLQFSISNRGMQPLSTFDIAYQMPNAESVFTTFALDNEPLEFGQSASFELPLPVPEGLLGPDQKLLITLLSPNGADNENASLVNDSLWFEIGETLTDDGSSPLLIEEFTSLDNGYAPIGQQHLREAIAQSERSVLIVSRHEGYGPNDALHPSNSDYSASFFGSDKLNFAPAVWIDRDQLPISSTLSVDSLVTRIAEVSHPRYASIQFDSVVYNTDNQQIEAYLEVTMHSISAFENPYLIVCFTQNEAKTPEQKNYYPEHYDGAQQRDVLRGFATLPSGGSLLTGSDLEAVAHGRVAVGKYNKQHLKATLSLPSNLSFSAGEWSLIAYISDRGKTHQLLGVSRWPANNN